MTGSTANTALEVDCPQCGAPVPLPEWADVTLCAFCGSTLARKRLEAPEAADGQQPEEQTLRSMQCSQCAGALSVREGKRVLVCSHCGVRFLVRSHWGFSRWYFPARMSRLDAVAKGAEWLREYPGLAKAAREARFAEARLFYAPIWEYKTLVAGWEFGYKVRTRNALVQDPRDQSVERFDLQIVREGVKEPRLQERRFYQAATDFEVLGATRPLVTGRELLVPLLPGELETGATVLQADGTAAAVAERGRRAVLQPLSGAVKPDSHMFAFREATTLLYYPLWLLRYEPGGRGRSCRIVVNGRNGNINAGVAPASQSRQLALLWSQLAALAAAVIVLAYFASTRDSGRASLIAGAVIVAAGAFFLGWRFRTRKEVRYHEPFSG